MKIIATKNDVGEYVGLLLGKLEEEDILGKEQLSQLQPYISSFIDSEPSLNTARGKLQVTVISDKKAAFFIDGENEAVASELLTKICNVCKNNLTNTLIVPQYMGNDIPTIYHRVIEFEVDKSQMFVKYCELGNFNNFDAAMQDIKGMYPHVRV